MDEATTERCPPPEGCVGDWLEELDRYLLGLDGFDVDLTLWDDDE